MDKRSHSNTEHLPRRLRYVTQYVLLKALPSVYMKYIARGESQVANTA